MNLDDSELLKPVYGPDAPARKVVETEPLTAEEEALIDSVLERISEYSFPDHKGRPGQVGGSLPREASGEGEDDVIKSANFKRWFTGSKVVDPSGAPKVVYHGTKNNVDQFNPEHGGVNSNVFGSWNVTRSGIFFAEDPKVAAGFAAQGGDEVGSNIIPVYLAIFDPLDLRSGNLSDAVLDSLEAHGYNPRYLLSLNPTEMWQALDVENNGREFVSALKTLGYDGLRLVEFDGDSGNSFDTWVAFDSTQVKSKFNIGNFDPKSSKISYARSARQVDFQALKRVYDHDALVVARKVKAALREARATFLQTIDNQLANLTPHAVAQLRVNAGYAAEELLRNYLLDTWRKGRDLAIKELRLKVRRGLEQIKGYGDWSEEEHPRDDQGRFATKGESPSGETFLHATPGDRLTKISIEGIKRDSPRNFNLSKPGRVYLTSKIQEAEYFGAMAISSSSADDEFVILEIQLPKEVASRLRSDGNYKRDSGNFVLDDDIDRSWIKSITRYNLDRDTGEISREGTKSFAENHTLYLPVLGELESIRGYDAEYSFPDHTGRPGEVGGSLPREGGGEGLDTKMDALRRRLETTTGIEARLPLQQELANLNLKKQKATWDQENLADASNISSSPQQLKWESTITSSERQAIVSYMSTPFDSSYSRQVQRADATGQGSSAILDVATRLRAAIKRAPKEEAVVYRGAQFKPKIGDEYNQDTFRSWTRDRDIAIGYAVSSAGPSVVLRLTTQVIDVGRLGPYGIAQKEVLVDKGLNAKIVKISSRPGSETVYADLEIQSVGEKKYQTGFEPTKALDYFATRALIVKGLIDDDLTRLAKMELLEHLKGGRSNIETMGNLRALFEPWVGDPEVIEESGLSGASEDILKAYRLETIVRTETTTALNQGRLAVADAAEDYIVGFEFSAILDERTTEVCTHADGLLIRKDSAAAVKLSPPLHHQCRSLLIFVTTDELPVEWSSEAEINAALELTPQGFK